MRALLWKDYRLNRAVLLLGATLLFGPYVAAAGLVLYESWPGWPARADWALPLYTAGMVSMGLSQLTLVTLAGNAIAAERADRSAEFLAYLPPSRRLILTSKLLLAGLAAAVIWAVNAAVAELLAPALNPAAGFAEFALGPWSILAAAAVMAFGSGWLGSAVLDSPAIATSVGIGASVAVPLLVQAVAVLTRAAPTPEQLLHWIVVTCLGLGALCFAGGTGYYLHRVEP